MSCVLVPQGERRPGFVGLPLPGVQVKLVQQQQQQPDTSSSSDAGSAEEPKHPSGAYIVHVV